MHTKYCPFRACVAAPARAACVPLLLLTLAGCSASRLDRSVEGLVQEQSDRLRAEVREPKLPDPPSRQIALDAFDRTPPTVNPPASEISIPVADPQRDVARRLEDLTRQSGVVLEPTSPMTPGEGAVQDTPEVQNALGEPLTLEQALRISQVSGREFLSAQEEYLLAAIRLLQERHLWGPRLFNDTSAFVSGSGDDGNFQHALDLLNTLRVTQRLPSGGEVEARWLVRATDQLRERATGGYTQSSELVLAGNIPLLRGAGTVARESLIQAERDLVYESRDFERFRRQYLVEVASDYFDLLETRSAIANQERQLASLERFNLATRARAEAGRLEAFQTAITENRLRSGVASLASLRESFTLQQERFRVRLGLPSDVPIRLSEELPNLPEPDVDLSTATQLALRFRLDLQNSQDRLADTRRALKNAENDTLPDLDVTGEVGIPTDPDDSTGGVALDGGETTYRVGATLSLPLDRTRERLNVRAARIRMERATREHEQLRDTIAVNVRGAVRSIELARFQLDLAEQQVEINRRRLRAQRLQEDVIDPQTIVDTENDLLQAENDRDRARTDLRTAVLNYLLESDQLRVTREGTLSQLR